jgi:hypothetical protein
MAGGNEAAEEIDAERGLAQSPLSLSSRLRLKQAMGGLCKKCGKGTGSDLFLGEACLF